MNRKQKIIVSITGIFLVLMILVGLTYAYFLTKITGNTNTKSISVTTANLAIVYEDNSAEILGKDLILEPNSEKEIGTKTFTVTNKGNVKTSYVVVIDETKITNATDGTTTTFESNDFRYTLTCTEGCNGVETQSVFPINGGILVGNSIDVGKVQTYELKLWYIDTGIDQTNDMNKRLEARINITDITQMENPYSANTNSLAYNIIENAKNKTNGTELVSSPKTIPVKETLGYKYYTDKVNEATSENSISISTKYQEYYWTYGTGYKVDENTGKFTLTGVSTCKYNDGTCHETLVGKYLVSSSVYSNSSSSDTTKTTTNLLNIYKATEAPASSTSAITMKVKKISPISYNLEEKVLSITNDDYGTSYYYRGSVKDNYIEFNNMCWRIVRIEGDGSIKIILAKEGLCSSITSSDSSSALINNGTIVYGYKQDNSDYYADYINYNGGLYTTLKAWYTSSGLENKQTQLKNETWCLGGKDSYRYNNETLLTDEEVEDLKNRGSGYSYASGKRLLSKASATLKCSSAEDSVTDYIGTITGDEIAYAGGKYDNSGGTSGLSNKLYYLYDNAQSKYWSLSRYGCLYMGHLNDMAFVVDDNGNLNAQPVNQGGEDYDSNVRPAVTLATGTSIISGGDGTISNPYVVKTN